MKIVYRIISLQFIMLSFCVSAMGQNDSWLKMENGKMYYIGESYEKLYNVVDTSRTQIVYLHIMYDSVLKKKDHVYSILALGDSHSKYYGYSNYRSDSINNSMSGKKIAMDDSGEKRKRMENAMFGLSQDRYLKDFDKETLRYSGYVIGSRYYYDEPLHGVEWNLEDETKEVLGHQCRKATTHWRGRDWTAWYSEIPFADGPCQFGGLPGLILELTDSTGEHKIRAKYIKHDNYPFGEYSKGSLFRIKRDRFLKIYKDYRLNPVKTFESTGLVTMDAGSGNTRQKTRRMFYCPIELE